MNNTFTNKLLQGDSLEVLKTLPSESVDCVVTSPPYWGLRDYGVSGQLGLEPTFNEYITKLCDIFDEVKRVLKKDGTCWVNIGDTYAANRSYQVDGNKQVNGSQPTAQPKAKDNGVSEKSLCQIPSRFAIEMTNRGWILRNEIIWHKPNCMPQSVKDRFTVDFEKVFFFVKSKKYYFETQYEEASNTSGWAKQRAKGKDTWEYGATEEAIKAKAFGHAFTKPPQVTESRNKRSVWKVSTKPFKDAHFATFPEALIETPIKAGCPKDGIVLDPFMGACTTALVARKLGRNYLGIELNTEYIKICDARLESFQPSLL